MIRILADTLQEQICRQTRCRSIGQAHGDGLTPAASAGLPRVSLSLSLSLSLPPSLSLSLSPSLHPSLPPSLPLGRPVPGLSVLTWSTSPLHPVGTSHHSKQAFRLSTEQCMVQSAFVPGARQLTTPQAHNTASSRHRRLTTPQAQAHDTAGSRHRRPIHAFDYHPSAPAFQISVAANEWVACNPNQST